MRRASTISLSCRYQHLDCSRLEEWLGRALDLNSEGVKIVVPNFNRSMDAEDFLHSKSCAKDQFDSKPTAEDCRILVEKATLNVIASNCGKDGTAVRLFHSYGTGHDYPCLQQQVHLDDVLEDGDYEEW